MYNKLEQKEFHVLCKIAKKTGMDCWFYIIQNENKDYVLDLEENKKLSLKRAVEQLVEGLAYPLIHEGLTNTEQEIFAELLKKLNITYSFEEIEEVK